MKSRVALAVFLLAALITVVARAQSPSSQPGAEKAEKAEKKDPLFFVKIAADIAGNVQTQSLNGYLAIYIDSQAWASALSDGDLGPFMKLKEGKAGRSAACLISDARDAGVCVFYDGDTPFGVASVKAGASGKIEAKDVETAYKPVSKEMLKKSEKELHFEPGDVAADDGQTLPAFQVSAPVKFSL
jgi:hypothetical protein